MQVQIAAGASASWSSEDVAALLVQMSKGGHEHKKESAAATYEEGSHRGGGGGQKKKVGGKENDRGRSPGVLNLESDIVCWFSLFFTSLFIPLQIF